MTKAQERCMKAAELNFWRKCIRKTVMDRVRKEDIRMAVSRNTTIMDRTEEKCLTWYGHIQRMEGQILQWIPRRRKKRGRPGRIWMDGVRLAMISRGLTNEDWQDMDFWQRRVT
ncbi:hypothetical protein ANN_17665 [Periplaneta americana]|uniref:Uncharacterized protein n=1 Tax=Periplaneta americana TaxID=6978 RepID=A0ABQ8SVP7_PERAM|nr:hypothetical protein ANN_17665 [Periplaneta americana]